MSAPRVLDRSASVPSELTGHIRGLRRGGQRRYAVVCAALVVTIAALSIASLSIGSLSIGFSETFAALFGQGLERTRYVVGSLRLPRVLVALAVGVAFGLSGALFQSLARNPLASPDVIGITAGASVGAVAVLTLVGGFSGLVSLGALGGSILIATLVFALSIGRGVSAFRLILVGLGLQAVSGAVIEYLLYRSQEDVQDRAMVWLYGSLNARSWDDVVVCAVVLVVLVPAAAALVRPLGALQLGEETAAGAGVAVDRSRAQVLLVGCALAAGGVTAAGPVTLIGFLGPPLARWLVRSPGPALLPSALMSAAVLLAADVGSRTLFGESSMPVGLVTGLIGAPYLLFMLLRANSSGRVG